MSSDKKAGNPNEPQGHLPKPGVQKTLWEFKMQISQYIHNCFVNKARPHNKITIQSANLLDHS